MIIVRFGKSGRMARICDAAIRICSPNACVYTFNRKHQFILETGTKCLTTYDSLSQLLRAHAKDRVILIDASVDHSSTSNLIKHEAFKRNLISLLHAQGLLDRIVGFSSGITLVSNDRIQKSAVHMLEYRKQKLEQEALFRSLQCPSYFPNVFTLIGPITYAQQAAAWAQILMARLLQAKDIFINEPDTKKAWVSEFTVFRSLLEFLAADSPVSTQGAFVEGQFTLSEIANMPMLNLPPVNYKTGSAKGWLDGNYLPESNLISRQAVHDELIKALFHQSQLDHATK